MNGTITKDKVTLSQKEYLKLKEAYDKLGEILHTQKKQKINSEIKTLKGIWSDVEVDEQDFEQAKNSLFKSS